MGGMNQGYQTIIHNVSVCLFVCVDSNSFQTAGGISTKPSGVH